MKIKSYYSRTVEDAMAAARHEMGPDAMLVNSRKAPPEVRHLGEYEVVFANAGPAVPPAEASLKLPGERGESMAVAPAPLGDRLSMEVAELKKELEGMRHAITRTAYARHSGSASRRTNPMPMPRSPPRRYRRSWPARSCRPRRTA